MSQPEHDNADRPVAHYIDEGPGVAPVVLLPGGSLNISYLAPVAHALVKAGHRVVRVDAVRHRGPVTMHDLADDVVAVMDALDLPPSWIAGHAFGNRVARTVALDHPDRVLGVILLAAGGTVAPSPEAQDALRITFSDVSDDDAVKAMVYMVGNPDDAASAWKAIKVARDPQLGAEQRQADISTPEDEWAGIAPGKPALIIQGSHDRMAPPANGEQLAKKYPDQVTLLSIEGAGHLFPFLHPDETAHLIESHI